MTTVARGRRAPDAEVWLSVQDASAMLGVSPATLRRWSAAGEVEAFTTPGGHRRFALSTLRGLLPRPEASPHLAVLGEPAERLVRVLRRHCRSAAQGVPCTAGLAPDERELLRGYGAAMVRGVVAHLDATGSAAGASDIGEAESAARAQARLLFERGAGLADAVATMLRFRALVVRELAELAVRRGLTTADATSLVARAGESVDRLVAAATVEYVAAQAASRG